MSKSNFKKVRLASALLLSTVLLPNIAYADEEPEQILEAETAIDVEEAQDEAKTSKVEQEVGTFNEENSDTEVNEETPSVNNNNDIDTNSEITEEQTDDGSGIEDNDTILEPVAQPDDSENVKDDVINERDEEADTEEPANTVEGSEEDVQEEEETPANETTNAPGEESTNDNTGGSEDELGEVGDPFPTDPIESIEPDEFEEDTQQPIENPSTDEGTESKVPSEENNLLEEEPADESNDLNEASIESENQVPDYNEKQAETDEPLTEASNEEVSSNASSKPKKLYRYDYGDILNGISFNHENIEDDISTLDQRVTRVMSSKIIEEKDLTEEQKLELEEKVKAEETTPHGAKELPDTGDVNTTNYTVVVLLSIFGATLLFMSKKLKTDN